MRARTQELKPMSSKTFLYKHKFNNPFRIQNKIILMRQKIAIQIMTLNKVSTIT